MLREVTNKRVGYVNLRTAQVMCEDCFDMIYPSPKFDRYVEENLLELQLKQVADVESWDCFSCHKNLKTRNKRGN